MVNDKPTKSDSPEEKNKESGTQKQSQEQSTGGTRRDMNSEAERIRTIDTPPGEPYNKP
jgi:hypothetical protein